MKGPSRFQIKSGNLIVEYDQLRMQKFEKDFTIEKFEPVKNELYVFLDEFGDERVAGTAKNFGLSGCAFWESAYTVEFKKERQNIKSNIFKVSREKSFHAKHHLKKIKSDGEKTLLEFFESSGIKFLATHTSFASKLIDPDNTLWSMLDSLDIVNKLFDKETERANWIYEHSYRLAPKLMMTGGPRYTRARTNYGPLFIDKNLCEPAAEIADLISYVVYKFSENKIGRRKSKYKGILIGCFAISNMDLTKKIYLYQKQYLFLVNMYHNRKLLQGRATGTWIAFPLF